MKKNVLFFIFLFLAFTCYSQNRSISGVVLDAVTNEPLPGATIMITGTQTGTSSGINGEFTLSVPTSAKTVTVNYIGYQSQTMNITDNMRILLHEGGVNLDEIVVIGYGAVKKRDLTGSVASMKSDELMKANPLNAQQAIQGRLAGVNIVTNDGTPGGGVSIQVRGVNSFLGGTEPLFVVDGVPISTSSAQETVSLGSDNYYSRNAFSFIDPNNIESIEILKDASSTAIYGSRGSNGVVLITTKTGRTKEDKIDINYNLTVSQVAKKIRMLSSREYAEYANLTAINTHIINGGTIYPSGVPYNYSTSPVTGEYTKGPMDFPDDDNTYWQDQIFRTAFSHDLNLNISGARDGMDYAISGGYLGQEGTVINSDYDRYNLRINFNKQIRKWLKIGTSTSYTYFKSNMIKTTTKSWNNGNEGVIRSALYFPPTYKVGDRIVQDNEYTTVSNPVLYAKALNENSGHTFYTSNYAQIDLGYGFTFKTTLGYTASLNYANQYWGRELWEGRDPISGLSLTGDNSWNSLVFDNILMYLKSFGKHNINATLGTSWEESHYYNKSASKSGFGTDLTQGWLIGEGADFQSTTSSKGDAQLFSLIFRAGYNYDNKYYLTLTARRDASSKFAKGKRDAFFPSFGVSWRASEEKFMKPVSHIFSNLKLRYSYGASGNQGIDSYSTFSLMSAANYPFDGTVENGYATNSYNPGNKDLTWETTWAHDAGLEVTLFNRVNLEVDVYNKRTKDLLQRKQKPYSTGLKQVYMNLGTVENKGLEITTNVTAISNKVFNWTVGGNISFNKNNIINMGGGKEFPNELWNSYRPFILEAGHSIGQMYGFIEDGIWGSREEVINSAQFQKIYSGYSVNDNTASTESIIKQKWIGEIRYKDLNGDDVISDDDMTYIGDTNPSFYYGFNSSVTYKSFDFNILFQGVYGNDILNQPLFRFYESGGPRNIPVDILKEVWSPDNPTGSAPKLYETYSRTARFSRRYIDSGSYLKLRSLTIGYTLKNPIKGISSMRFYVAGNNLLTFTHYSGYDPEVNAFGSDPTLRGVDAGGYPQSRSFIIGTNFSF